jgi:hypothetical protein
MERGEAGADGDALKISGEFLVPTKKEVIDDMNALSAQLSERTRSVAGGIIAIWWALLVGSRTDDATSQLKALLIGPVALAAVTFMIDFVQFSAGYYLTWHRFRLAEKSGSDEINFDASDWRYRLRLRCFQVKQITVGIALVWLIIVLVTRVRLQ